MAAALFSVSPATPIPAAITFAPIVVAAAQVEPPVATAAVGTVATLPGFSTDATTISPVLLQFQIPPAQREWQPGPQRLLSVRGYRVPT